MKYGKNPRGYVATAPSAESIKKAFGISKKKAQTIRRLMKSDIKPYTAGHYHIMVAISMILHGYGVGSFDATDLYGQDCRFYYVDMGNTGFTTIMYRQDQDRYYITTYVDAINLLQRQGWRSP